MIAKQQQALIEQTHETPKWMDTDILTIKIWSEVKYGSCDKWILKTWKNKLPDFYILCPPDIPWEPDPLRESPTNRQQLFDIYFYHLVLSQVDFIVLEGNWEERKEALLELFK